MTDIVERMKNYIPGENDEFIPEVLQLACDEIERLREALRLTVGDLLVLIREINSELAVQTTPSEGSK